MRTALALGILLAAPALAYADDFATVDSFEAHGSYFSVRGVPVGQSQAVSRDFSYYGSNYTQYNVDLCQRAGFLAMERPGRYTFTIESGSEVGFLCKLTRNPGK